MKFKQFVPVLALVIAGTAGTASAAVTAADFDTADVLAGILVVTGLLGAIGAAITSGPRLVKAGWGWVRGMVR
jgi:hypothetical protein